MKRKIYVAKIQRDLFTDNEIMRLYVEHKDVMKLEDDLKEYLEVNYGLKNIYLHTYPVDKKDENIIKRVATVVCL